MSAKNHSLQDTYLNHLRKEKIPVLIYLINGTLLKGIVNGFDNFVVLIKKENLQLIYKHAISTIVPEKDVDLKFSDYVKEQA